MTKFCPNCGAKIKANAQFCPNCGKSIAKTAPKTPTPQPQPVQPAANYQRAAAPKPKRIKKKKRFNPKYSIIAAVIILLVGIGGSVGYYFYQNKQVEAAVDKMPKKKLAGLAIVYAHIHYKKNPAWKKVYKEAVNGNVAVNKYKHYDLNGYQISATDGNDVYVINDKVAFTTEKNKRPSQSKVILTDGKKTLGEVSTTEAYKEAKNHDELNTVQKINATETKTIDISTKQLAVLVGLYRLKGDADDIQSSIDEHMCTITIDDQYPEYYHFSLGGSGGSDTYFKKDGNNVLLKYLDIRSGIAAADAKMKDHQISLKDLINKYYSTSEQKEQVNDLANQLTVEKANNDSSDSDENNSEDTEDTSSEDSSNDEKQEASEKKTGKYSNLPLVTIPAGMRGTWYAAGLFGAKLGDKTDIGTNTVNGRKIYYLKKTPDNESDLKELKKNYGAEFVETGELSSNSISYTQGGGQTDASGYGLIKIDGVSCLKSSSGMPTGIYFKTPELAKKFTDKYKNDDNFEDKVANAD